MSPERSDTLSRFILLSKWGGCFTALVFALGGLLFDLAGLGGAYETLGQDSWIVVAISSAFGLTGVILDRSHKPRSSNPGLHN